MRTRYLGFSKAWATQGYSCHLYSKQNTQLCKNFRQRNIMLVFFDRSQTVDFVLSCSSLFNSEKNVIYTEINIQLQFYRCKPLVIHTLQFSFCKNDRYDRGKDNRIFYFHRIMTAPYSPGFYIFQSINQSIVYRGLRKALATALPISFSASTV